MRISVITVCFNSEKTIENTIKSVLSQNYKDIEYIIVDGGSKDETINLISKHKEKISIIKSEPDKGIYDAINKGISLASGKIISINEKGLTVNIAKNINGFIKKTDLAKDKLEQRIDRFAVNETIDSMITSFDEKSKKINLSIKDIEINEEKKFLKKYGSKDSGASLGDILSDTLKKNKSS